MSSCVHRLRVVAPDMALLSCCAKTELGHSTAHGGHIRSASCLKLSNLCPELFHIGQNVMLHSVLLLGNLCAEPLPFLYKLRPHQDTCSTTTPISCRYDHTKECLEKGRQEFLLLL